MTPAIMRYSAFVVAVLLAACSAGAPAGDRAETARLDNTVWMVTRLGSDTVAVAPGQRAPYLLLQRDERRVSGFTGCNQLSGAYSVAGPALRFGPMITTKMACLRGMETEAAFTAALERVRAWSRAGRLLTLSDEDGRPVAILETGATP